MCNSRARSNSSRNSSSSNSISKAVLWAASTAHPPRQHKQRVLMFRHCSMSDTYIWCVFEICTLSVINGLSQYCKVFFYLVGYVATISCMIACLFGRGGGNPSFVACVFGILSASKCWPFYPWGRACSRCLWGIFNYPGAKDIIGFISCNFLPHFVQFR